MKLWEKERDRLGNVISYEIPEYAKKYFYLEQVKDKKALMSPLPINLYKTEWEYILQKKSNDLFKNLIQKKHSVLNNEVLIIDFFWQEIILDLLKEENYLDNNNLFINFAEIVVGFIEEKYGAILIYDLIKNIKENILNKPVVFGSIRYDKSGIILINNILMRRKLLLDDCIDKKGGVTKI